jgi:hypothetical protein
MPRLKGSADLLEDRRRRALALLDDGLSLNEVGRQIGCNPSSVTRWRDARRHGGLIPALVSIALELWQSHMPGPMVRTQNVPANLFGIAAGVLLGLNIRMMRNSEKSIDNVRSDSSRSAMY